MNHQGFNNNNNNTVKLVVVVVNISFLHKFNFYNLPVWQIETQKIDIKAESKIGSLDNVKHKPGGGDKKIFNDKDYLRQTSSNAESLNGSGSQVWKIIFNIFTL